MGFAGVVATDGLPVRSALFLSFAMSCLRDQPRVGITAGFLLSCDDLGAK